MVSGRVLDRRKSPRYITNGNLPGKIVFQATGMEIPCRSLDVSNYGLGLSSDIEIPLTAKLILTTETDDVPFTVVSATKTADRFTGKRYGLFLDNEYTDLVDQFRRAGCILENPDVAPKVVDSRAARAARFSLDHDVRIEVKTLGTRSSFTLVIENLSRSGLLLAITFDDELPFRVNTLLDMIIDPDQQTMPSPIKATGKVVRRMDEDRHAQKSTDRAPLTRLGIVIVDIAPEEEAKWLNIMVSLEDTIGFK